MRRTLIVVGVSFVTVLLVLGGCAKPAPAPEAEPPPEAAPTLDYSEICSELSKLCPELALELERLPEIREGISEQGLEALNDIYSLYAKAKNPEVREAFDLMLRGDNAYEDKNVDILRSKEIAKKIRIDGEKDDWEDLKPMCVDISGDDIKKVEGTDILAVYAIMDDKCLYIIFETLEKPNKDAGYIFPIDVNGDGDWDYSVGFNAHSAWFYDLRNYRNGEWPKTWETLTDMSVAFGQVAEFKVLLSKIGEPPAVTIYPWIVVYSPEVTTTDQTTVGVVARKPFAPDWNTELQALFELALDNEFEKDDTTALAIALVDGFFRTVGDKYVMEQVRKDDNETLNLAREISLWQEANGLFPLNGLQLEAKVAWAWRGNVSMARGPFNLQNYRTGKLSLKGYLWNTVDPDTLRDMREEAQKMGWLNKDINNVVKKIEDYFFGRQLGTGIDHWEFWLPPELIKDVKGEGISSGKLLVEGVNVNPGELLNVEYQFYDRFKKGKYPQGECQAESVFVDAWIKSLGSSSLIVWKVNVGDFSKELTKKSGIPTGTYLPHNWTIYYVPEKGVWSSYDKQLTIRTWGYSTMCIPFDFRIYKPPVNQVHYQDEWEYRSGYEKGKMYHLIPSIEMSQIREMLLSGISTSELKQWLLYSTATNNG